MQAIRLQKKYPEISQDEMFDLINRFKWVGELDLLYQVSTDILSAAR